MAECRGEGSWVTCTTCKARNGNRLKTTRNTLNSVNFHSDISGPSLSLMFDKEYNKSTPSFVGSAVERVESSGA